MHTPEQTGQSAGRDRGPEGRAPADRAAAANRLRTAEVRRLPGRADAAFCVFETQGRRLAAAVGLTGVFDMVLAIALTWLGSILMSKALLLWGSHHLLRGYIAWGWQHRQTPQALLRMLTPAFGHALLEIVFVLPVGAIGLAVLITGVEGVFRTVARTHRRWRAATA